MTIKEKYHEKGDPHSDGEVANAIHLKVLSNF